MKLENIKVLNYEQFLEEYEHKKEKLFDKYNPGTPCDLDKLMREQISLNELRKEVEDNLDFVVPYVDKDGELGRLIFDRKKARDYYLSQYG